MSDLIDRLLELENAGWQSLCDSTGGDFYGKLMSADGRMILANGRAMSREDVVESLGDAPPWDSYDISEPHLVSVGAGVATLVYSGTGRGEGDDDFTAIMSST